MILLWIWWRTAKMRWCPSCSKILLDILEMTMSPVARRRRVVARLCHPSTRSNCSTWWTPSTLLSLISSVVLSQTPTRNLASLTLDWSCTNWLVMESWRESEFVEKDSPTEWSTRISSPGMESWTWLECELPWPLLQVQRWARVWRRSSSRPWPWSSWRPWAWRRRSSGWATPRSSSGLESLEWWRSSGRSESPRLSPGYRALPGVNCQGSNIRNWRIKRLLCCVSREPSGTIWWANSGFGGRSGWEWSPTWNVITLLRSSRIWTPRGRRQRVRYPMRKVLARQLNQSIRNWKMKRLSLRKLWQVDLMLSEKLRIKSGGLKTPKDLQRMKLILPHQDCKKRRRQILIWTTAWRS